MTRTPTRAIGRHRRRLALVATLALTASVTPAVTPTSAYLTAERLQAGNTIATANLAVENLTATRDKRSLTRFSGHHM